MIFAFSARNAYLFNVNVFVVSLKIYLFVHLINSSESFGSSSYMNWMDCRQLSISHMYLWILIQYHRPHSMSVFIYLLSELSESHRLAAYVCVLMLQIHTLVFVLGAAIRVSRLHYMLPNNWHDFFFQLYKSYRKTLTDQYSIDLLI